MEKPKHLSCLTIVLCLILVGYQPVASQSAYKKTIYNAYIKGDMAKWAAVINILERSEEGNTVDHKLELVSYYYGYIGYLLGLKKNDEAQKLVEKGESHLRQVLRADPRNATAYAFRGAFIGFRIGISKFKAIALGPEGSALVDKALELDSKNVQAIIDRGNALLYTPALFGGDKQEAIKLFHKGARLLETSQNTENNWFYLSILTTTARAYEKTNDYAKAKTMYEKILLKEPNFRWVKEELYPKLLAKIK